MADQRIESVWNDADDLRRISVDYYRSPDYARVRTKPLPPESFSKYGHAVGAGDRVERANTMPGPIINLECSAENGIDTKDFEEARGNIGGGDQFDAVRSGVRILITAECRHSIESVALLPPVGKVLPGSDCYQREVAHSCGCADSDKPVGLFKWQRPEQHCIDYAEDTRV